MEIGWKGPEMAGRRAVIAADGNRYKILRNGSGWENWVYFVRCLEPVHRQPLEGYPAPFYFRAWRFFPSPLAIYHSVISSLSCLHYGK